MFRVCRRTAVAAFLCLLMLGHDVFAQSNNASGDRTRSRSLFEVPDRQGIGSVIPMEGAVDEDEYRIGPGDVFVVTIGGPEPTAVSLPVSADGRLLVPGVGGIVVAGEVLKKAREDVIAAMRPYFQRVQLDVSLAQPRQFYVHVSGAVPVPGRYIATPVARVSSVIELAYADTTRQAVTNREYRPSFRNVTLKRSDGSERSLDLQRYLSTGDTSQNPYLQDGDVIAVGVYDPARESVYIDGSVPYPGSYAYREGDTALDLIAIATGKNPSLEGIGQVRVTSRADGRATTRTFRVSEGEQPEVDLAPLDHIFVLGDDALRGSASVGGWVRYPGTYPIEPGRTTLGEVVEMAGGLREGALLRGIYLERRSIPLPELRTRRANRFDFAPGASQILVRSDSAAVLRNMRLTNLDFMSRAYFAQEMQLQNRVSVDPEHLQADVDSPIVLQDGDRLMIPRDEQTVYVFGQVNRPGFVAVRPGARAEQYVEAAGGRSGLAAGTYVIEAGSGRHLTPRDASISSGDMIFVDRKGDIADSAELQRLLLESNRARADARIRTAQTVLQVVGTAATLVTTYLFVRNNR